MNIQKYFSASTKGFYSSEIHGDQMPADAVAISDEQYRDIQAKHVSGHRIQADAKGMPIAVPPPPGLSLEESMRISRAKKALSDSDIVVLRCYEEAAPVPPEWVAYRKQLREVVAGTRTDLPTPPGTHDL